MGFRVGAECQAVARGVRRHPVEIAFEAVEVYQRDGCFVQHPTMIYAHVTGCKAPCAPLVSMP